MENPSSAVFDIMHRIRHPRSRVFLALQNRAVESTRPPEGKLIQLLRCPLPNKNIQLVVPTIWYRLSSIVHSVLTSPHPQPPPLHIAGQSGLTRHCQKVKTGTTSSMSSKQFATRYLNPRMMSLLAQSWWKIYSEIAQMGSSSKGR